MLIDNKSKIQIKTLLFISGLIVICLGCSIKSDYSYKDSGLSTDERVEDLLARMTLDEKIAQLSMKRLKYLNLDSTGNVTKASLDSLFQGKSVGCLESPFVDHETIAKVSKAADRYLRKSTRLGIPAIQVAEGLHGMMALGATIFPQAIAQGSTWNTGLIKQMGHAIAKEAKLAGVDQLLSPLFDLAVDPRYGRVEECFGEDPYLVSELGVALVHAYQGNPNISKDSIPPGHIMCTAKHLAAYSQPQSGINIAPARIGERDLRTFHLAPFEAAVKKGNVYSIMPGYHELDGIPMHANKWVIQDIVREEWGFEGYVFSDYGGIKMLETFHKVAQNKKEAALIALKSGIDLDAPKTYAYQELSDLVQEGRLTEKQLNISVRRILTAKFKAGLFDTKFNVDPDRANKIHTKEHINLAKEIADESIILLKNENNILPLDKTKINSMAVIGPNANRVQFGDYSVTKSNDYGNTILEGIKESVGQDVKINYARGCGITTLDKSGFPEALNAAKNSDVVVLVIGGTSVIYSGIGWGDDQVDKESNTCGEGYDRTTLDPPGVQSDLIRAIYKTGKPIILVMVHGRPYSVPWEADHIPAILEAWYPGEQGGRAVADILFGEVNPSGKLTMSVPGNVGQIPVNYSSKPSGRGYYKKPGTPQNPGRDYVFSGPAPLYPFGHGLSYTKFEYSNLKISHNQFSVEDTIKISLHVKNSGQVTGKEVVQVYINDLVSSITTPVKMLKGFQKQEILPGYIQSFYFEIPCNEMGLWNGNMDYMVESGTFEIMIGSSSEDIRLTHRMKIN